MSQTSIAQAECVPFTFRIKNPSAFFLVGPADYGGVMTPASKVMQGVVRFCSLDNESTQLLENKEFAEEKRESDRQVGPVMSPLPALASCRHASHQCSAFRVFCRTALALKIGGRYKTQGPQAKTQEEGRKSSPRSKKKQGPATQDARAVHGTRGTAGLPAKKTGGEMRNGVRPWPHAEHT